MNVVALTAHYLPGYKAGGPARSLANLAARLGNEINFRIIAADRDLGDAQRYDGIGSRRWQQVGKAQVAYIPPFRTISQQMADLIREARPDALYINSFFNHRISFGPLLLRRLRRLPDAPIVLAPRGEFSRGAMALSRWKKKPYLAAARAAGLLDGVLWHATSVGEQRDVQRVIGDDATIAFAPNLCEPMATPTRTEIKQRGRLRLACVSRISPMKNLLTAIELLQPVRGIVQFDIWGPMEDRGYWQRCLQRISNLPSNISVEYRGPVEPARVRPMLSTYDALLLPTLGENFGHIIVESLTAGCPTVISDRTPWRQLADRGAGWDLPLEAPAAFHSALNDLVEMDDATHDRWRQGAVNYGRLITENPADAGASRELFRMAVGRTAARSAARAA